jgi:DNA-damage-inducible protein J
MKTLQVRVSDELRSDADAVLDEMGLDLPTAIRLYLNKIVQTRSIPFTLEAGNGVFVEEVKVDSITQKKMDAVSDAWRKVRT